MALFRACGTGIGKAYKRHTGKTPFGCRFCIEMGGMNNFIPECGYWAFLCQKLTFPSIILGAQKSLPVAVNSPFRVYKSVGMGSPFLSVITCSAVYTTDSPCF